MTNFWDGQQWLISLTNSHLILQGRPIALDEIMQVAYWHRTKIGVPGPANSYGSGMYIYRGFSVVDRGGHTSSLNFDNPLARDIPENEIAWRGLADISRQYIEPRIAGRIHEAVRGGEEYTIDDGWCFITLTNRGFTGRAMRTRTYSWADFYHVEVNPAFNNLSPSKQGQTRIWALTGKKRKLRFVTGLDTTVPNAVVLASLMPMCAQALATRIV
ncbi:hypothetical protein [Mycobacterium branderi]|uniref:hypothetical protein n=1 Tax=Mycobacterium branderi TaxID=43348 RepID=UPI00111C3B40|nr:hypothetical protein [Mycobacterium branderi]MCV7236277.1 hypothetical protein [Mycobacterium branderi]